MAERLTPGVYVEEISSGIKPIQGVGTSTVGFIGETARGVPNQATFVRGFADFRNRFGGHQRGAAGHMAQAVEAFFLAGGTRGYIVRVLPGDAVVGLGEAVTAAQDDPWGDDREVLRFDAIGAGAWSQHVRINLTGSGVNPGRAFTVEIDWVEGGRTRTVETFRDVVLDPEAEDYVVEVVNDTSRYVRVTDLHAQALNAEVPTVLPIPAVPPRLEARDEARLRVAIGSSWQVSWTTPERADDDQVTATVTFSADAIADLDNPPPIAATVELTQAHLSQLLAVQLGPPADGDLTRAFRVLAATDDQPTRIEAPIAGNAYLAVEFNPADSAHDLSNAGNLTLTIADGDGGNPTAVTLEGGAGTPLEDPMTLQGLADALNEAIAADDLDDIVEASVVATDDRQTLLLRTLTGREAGTGLTLEAADEDPWVGQQALQGAAGLVVEDETAVTIIAREPLVPGRPRSLTAVLTRTQATGYAESAGSNPALLPAATGREPLRLVGGTDGNAPVQPADYRGHDGQPRTGLHAFDEVDIQLLAMPGRNEEAFLAEGVSFVDNRNIFFIADGPGSHDRDFLVETNDVVGFVEGLPSRTDNMAMFYPWLEVSDPVGVGRDPRRFVPPSGHLAGVFARTDRQRGVWKAPAGLEATISGALDLQQRLLDADQDLLNPIGLSCIRQRPGAGIVSWGARTLSSDPEWRYIPVRRTALFLKESLLRGLQWVVFEPNDQDLWQRISSNITAFMLSLYRQGAFQGATADEAFAVKCDRETNPQELIDQGIVTAQVAFAPLKPAEFVVVEISQKTLVAA